MRAHVSSVESKGAESLNALRTLNIIASPIWHFFSLHDHTCFLPNICPSSLVWIRYRSRPAPPSICVRESPHGEASLAIDLFPPYLSLPPVLIAPFFTRLSPISLYVLYQFLPPPQLSILITLATAPITSPGLKTLPSMLITFSIGCSSKAFFNLFT